MGVPKFETKCLMMIAHILLWGGMMQVGSPGFRNTIGYTGEVSTLLTEGTTRH